MIDLIQKKYANNILKPYLTWYLKKARFFKYEDLNLKIYPGVFHPGYFFSSLFFASYMNELVLRNKRFCEVGSGSGLISLIALKKGSRVTSVELNETAVEGLKENIQNNIVPRENITVIKTDLFDSVPQQTFDVVFINPPYFFKDVTGKDSLAWNCGRDGSYFEKLFLQLPDYITPNSSVYMTLAENCDITRIKQIAAGYKQQLVCVKESKIKWEKNFIFKVIHL